ncbi:MAG: hypothetical protein ACKVIM_03915 [Flavobacteriales bacterium]|jgi:uncharacterized protein YjbJ (UPF0337 family)
MKKVLFIVTIVAALGFSVISCKSEAKKETEEKETVLEVQKISDNKVAGMESYATIEEAKSRAKKMGCEGYHEIKDGENVRYMPCNAHGDIKSQIEGDEGKAKSHLKEAGHDLKKDVKKADADVKKEYEKLKGDVEKKSNKESK